MQRFRLPRHGNFHTVDEPHAVGFGFCARLGQTAQFVVISQRVQLYALPECTLHHRGRRQHAVGIGGMAVEINVQHMTNYSIKTNSYKTNRIITETRYCGVTRKAGATVLLANTENEGKRLEHHF